MVVVQSFPFQNARGGKAMDPAAIAAAAKLDKDAAATRAKKADNAPASAKAKPRLQPVGLTNGK